MNEPGNDLLSDPLAGPPGRSVVFSFIVAIAEVVHSDEARTEASLSVGGMTCGACAARIERQLNALDGVEARVNFATERAKVVLAATTSVDRVIEEIRSAGFSAEPLADRDSGSLR